MLLQEKREAEASGFGTETGSAGCTGRCEHVAFAYGSGLMIRHPSAPRRCPEIADPGRPHPAIWYPSDGLEGGVKGC